MFNRKVEALPRSVLTVQNALLYSQLGRPGDLPSISVDQRSVELAQLFAKEERLAAQIAEPNSVNKDTIYEVVAMARKIAANGYSTNLVPLDEMLDIAQIFCLRVPILAYLMQCAVLDGPRHPQFRRHLTNTEFLNYSAELTTSPSPDAATSILGDLLAKLKDNDSSVWKDPVWTARVAAVLAYFSALQPN